MTDKPILIAYATRTGTTREIAEALGAGMARRGAQVEVKRMEDVDDLGRYLSLIHI